MFDILDNVFMSASASLLSPFFIRVWCLWKYSCRYIFIFPQHDVPPMAPPSLRWPSLWQQRSSCTFAHRSARRRFISPFFSLTKRTYTLSGVLSRMSNNSSSNIGCNLKRRPKTRQKVALGGSPNSTGDISLVACNWIHPISVITNEVSHSDDIPSCKGPNSSLPFLQVVPNIVQDRHFSTENHIPP